MGKEPATFFAHNDIFAHMAQPLLVWYRKNARQMPWRGNPQPYWVWISEIMLQQTRVEAVRPYFTRFVHALPTIEALASVEEGRLLKLWEGLGYYNRARNLKKAAQLVMEQGGSLPADYAALKKLPGIGDYTASAIASIAFGLPEPVVDGNVLRVVTRMAGSYSDVSSPACRSAVRDLLGKVIPHDCPGDFNQAVMELGALVCLPNGAPLCEACPLCKLCTAFEAGIAAELPVKTSKKPRKEEKKSVLILRTAGKVAVRQRPAHGLLARVWEFPSLEGLLEENQVAQYLQSCGACVQTVSFVGEYRHIFTHIVWDMRGFFIDLAEPWRPLDYHYVSIDELTGKYCLPSAFRFCMQALMQKKA